MTRFMELILGTLALLFITGTSTSPIRCDHGMGRYGGGSGYSSHALRYCRDEFDDDDDYYGNRGGGGRYYDYDGEREDWDSNEDEDFLDGGNYGNEDSDNGEDDFFGFHHHNHEA